MKDVMQKVVGVGIGLTVLFLLAGGATITNTGLTTTTYQGILLLVFVLAIVGVALAFFAKK
jgi:hypothetical protein